MQSFGTCRLGSRIIRRMAGSSDMSPRLANASAILGSDEESVSIAHCLRTSIELTA